MNANMSRFNIYTAKKEEMIARLGYCNEKWVWHGTDFKSIPLLQTNGFLHDYSQSQIHDEISKINRDADLSLSQRQQKVGIELEKLRDRQAVGQGSYFSTSASYSFNERYARPVDLKNNQRAKVLILSRILAGDSIKG